MLRLLPILFATLLCARAFGQADDVTVAVYYFPNYHPDTTNERWHGHGWSEWDLVKHARPRFPGHQQPKVPTWGYFDESDPRWAAKEIDAAANAGIDCFIYDWYWYEQTGGPYLHEGLEKGFLKAPNRQRLKFALMWANHDWMNIHPTHYTNRQEKLTEGEVSWETFERITDYVIERYFKQPNYWKIDGKPFFSIFETVTFINGMGNVARAAEALRRFDAKTKAAGFAGLHLNLIDQGVTTDYLRYALAEKPTRETVLATLPVASMGTYNFLHPYNLSQAGWPTANYQQAVETNVAYWPKTRAALGNVAYHPNVTMGWDVTPRLIQSEKFDRYRGYPWTPVFNGDNTPARFRTALERAKAFLQTQPGPRILTINAWNEWTEGSYLLPDTRTGTGYLDAIRAVFGTTATRRK